MGVAASDRATSPEEEVFMVKRQFPKPSEIFDLLHFKMPTLNAKKRRLQDSLTIWDLKKIDFSLNIQKR